MSNRKPTVDREEVLFTIEQGNKETYVNIQTPEPTKRDLEKRADEYGFPSLASFCRAMIYLGMNTVVDQDPSNQNFDERTSTESQTTIEELIPKGEENSVHITGEFWSEVLEPKMLDIIAKNPNIKRDGFEIYR